MIYSIAILAIMFHVGEALAICALIAAALEIFRKKGAEKHD